MIIMWVFSQYWNKKTFIHSLKKKPLETLVPVSCNKKPIPNAK